MKEHSLGQILLLCALLTPYWAGCAERESPSVEREEAEFLFVWSGDADEQDSDFMAVIDARATEPTYGQVVATLPVGAIGTMPHHLEYEYPANDILFANGWVAGRTFLIDVTNPFEPKLAGEVHDAGGYSFPHSFARLPNGHVLATFQGRDGRYSPPGGLVELDAEGVVVQTASAETPDIETDLNWPYSLAFVPGTDRVVSTSADMGMAPWDQWEYHDTYHVQVWSTDSLRLLSSVALPPDAEGKHNIAPAEPRVLADGTVYVITFSCGLYRMTGLETDHPEAVFLRSFPGGELGDECFVPVVYGRFWVQPVPALPGLVVLDTSDPANPGEVFSLTLDERYHMPHWVAADRGSGRLVVTGDHQSWVLVVDIDEETGALSIDEAFKDTGADHPGVSFDRPSWPHGETGAAVVHGALFGG